MFYTRRQAIAFIFTTLVLVVAIIAIVLLVQPAIAQDTIPLEISAEQLPTVGGMDLMTVEGITITYSTKDGEGGCLDAWSETGVDEGVCADFSTIERIETTVITSPQSPNLHLYSIVLVRRGDLREGLDQFDWDIDLGLRNFMNQLGQAARQIWNNTLDLLESRDIHLLLRVYPNGIFAFGSWQQI